MSRRLSTIAMAGFGTLAGLGGCANDLPLAGANTSEATSVFSLFAPPSPVEAAAMAVNEYSADERQLGTLLLANAPWGNAEVYVRLYRLNLDDEDAAVRTAAVRAIGLHGSPDDAPRVAELMSGDPDRLVRWEAARTLQRLHNPAVIRALVLASDGRNEPEVPVREGAATALGQYAEQRVLDALILALDDPDLTVNAAARSSLRTLTGEDFGYLPRPWVDFVRGNPDPFAERLAYTYPAYSRDRLWFEWFNPFFELPNEISAAPVGMTGEQVRREQREDADDPGR
jgi:hypothetical protein